MHETGGFGRLMIERAGRRRLMAGVLALLLLFSLGSASAAGFGGLEAAWALSGFGGELGLSLNAWPDLSAETLETMQAWMKELRLTAHAREAKGEGTSGLALYDGGRLVLQAESHQAGDESRLTLSLPGALAPTAYLGTAETPPAAILFDLSRLPDFGPLLAALPGFSGALIPTLQAYEKAETSSATIRRVGKAASRLSYVLSAEEANAWWQQTLPALLPLWVKAAAGFPGAVREEGARLLSSLRFTGRLSIRRLMDRDGVEIGFQVTAGLELLGKARKLDFIAGHKADTGFYLSLKLPAARGRDSLEALVSLAFPAKEGARGIQGELSLNRVLDGDKRALAAKVDLTIAPEGGGERLGGEITFQRRDTGSAPLKRDYRLTPELLADGGSLAGSLQWVESEGKKVLRDLVLTLALAPGEAPDMPSAQAQVNLRQADERALTYAKQQATQALLPYLREKLLALPQATRLLVLHDWGRERRALDPRDTEPLPRNEAFDFTVTEDAETLPDTKEETP